MNHFKQAAPTWDKPERVQMVKAYAEKIKAHLHASTNLKILEVGCGTGLLGSNFLDGKNKILGIDTSKDMLEVFDQKFKGDLNIRSKFLNLEEQDLDEKNFDLILSSMAFHHLKNPDMVLKKLKNLLSPSGLIAIVDLDEEDGSFHPDPKNMGVHHFGFAKSNLVQWAESSDFKNFSHEIIHTVKKNGAAYPVFLAVYGN